MEQPASSPRPNLKLLPLHWIGFGRIAVKPLRWVLRDDNAI
jgi:hypothetical protein